MLRAVPTLPPAPRHRATGRLPLAMRRVPVTITLRGDEYEVLCWHVRHHMPTLSVEVMIEEVMLDVVANTIRNHQAAPAGGDAPDGHEPRRR
jgi:hypothetical protein